MDLVTTISTYGIPVTHHQTAVSSLSNHDPSSGRHFTAELSKLEMEERIGTLLGIEQPVFESTKYAKLNYGYTIQEILKAHERDELSDAPVQTKLWEHIQHKVSSLISKSPWAVREYDLEASGEPKLDGNGNPKQAKGAKKALAIKVYNENKNVERSRKDWIALLVEQVGLTPAGASTYYANLKSGKLSTE